MVRLINYLLVVGLSCLGLVAAANADEDIGVVVTGTYIDVHTGPGRGYPIFHVLEKDEQVIILKRRTDWFKIKTVKDIEGWVYREHIAETKGVEGEEVLLSQADIDTYNQRRWETGFSLGDFEGADSFGVHVAYRFTNNVSVEARFNKAIGSFSNSQFATIGLTHQAFPHWRLSPFFTLGAGLIQTEPNTTLIKTQDREDNLLHVGVGAYYYITRRFMARIEYNNYTILTTRDQNEDIDEWKLGFSVFF